jgi:hypothetical protein
MPEDNYSSQLNDCPRLSTRRVTIVPDYPHIVSRHDDVPYNIIHRGDMWGSNVRKKKTFIHPDEMAQSQYNLDSEKRRPRGTKADLSLWAYLPFFFFTTPPL